MDIKHQKVSERSSSEAEDCAVNDHTSAAELNNSHDVATSKIKDDFEDTELDSDVENIGSYGEEDVDKLEEEMMNMPSLHEVLQDLNLMKTERKVVLSHLNYADVAHPDFQSLVRDSACEEVKIHFVRPKNKNQEWSGFVTLHFYSTSAAEEAAETIRGINPAINVRTKNDTFGSGQAEDQWAKSEKESKHWTDRMLYIKNVSPSVGKDQLEELFPSADDIVLRPVKNKGKKEEELREAYAMYRSTDVTQSAACEYAEKVIELDGYQLKIFKYHTPTSKKNLSGYLQLRERRVVLKYYDRLLAVLEAGREDETFTVPDWCEKRLNICKMLIDKDDRARSLAGLSAPSLVELREIPGIAAIRGTERRDLLIKLGVIDRPKVNNSNTSSTNQESASKNSSGGRVNVQATNRKRKMENGSTGDGSITSSGGKKTLLGAAPSLLSINTGIGPPVPSLLGSSPWMFQGSLSSSGSQYNVNSKSTPTPLLSLSTPTPLMGHSVPTPLMGLGTPTPLLGHNAPTPLLGHSPTSIICHSTPIFSTVKTSRLRMDASGEYHQASGSGGSKPRSSSIGNNSSARGKTNERRGRGGGSKPVSLLSL